jgi:hypothetical protein
MKHLSPRDLNQKNKNIGFNWPTWGFDPGISWVMIQAAYHWAAGSDGDRCGLRDN